MEKQYPSNFYPKLTAHKEPQSQEIAQDYNKYKPTYSHASHHPSYDRDNNDEYNPNKYSFYKTKVCPFYLEVMHSSGKMWERSRLQVCT